MAFVWAVPASFVLLLPFNHIWGKKEWFFPLTTTLIWTLLVAVYVEMGIDIANNAGWELGYVLLLGIPVTAISFLIHRYRMQKKQRNAKEE